MYQQDVSDLLLHKNPQRAFPRWKGISKHNLYVLTLNTFFSAEASQFQWGIDEKAILSYLIFDAFFIFSLIRFSLWSVWMLISGLAHTWKMKRSYSRSFRLKGLSWKSLRQGKQPCLTARKSIYCWPQIKGVELKPPPQKIKDPPWREDGWIKAFRNLIGQRDPCPSEGRN